MKVRRQRLGGTITIVSYILDSIRQAQEELEDDGTDDFHAEVTEVDHSPDVSPSSNEMWDFHIIRTVSYIRHLNGKDASEVALAAKSSPLSGVFFYRIPHAVLDFTGLFGANISTAVNWWWWARNICGPLTTADYTTGDDMSKSSLIFMVLPEILIRRH